MMTAEGPKVLEFNVRLGDPEAQALMHSFKGDFAEVLQMMISGVGGVPGSAWVDPSVCVVLAAAGYPETPQAGDVIQGIAEAEAAGATVFQAGTRRDDQQLVTAGGRVLGVTAGGETLGDAIHAVYATIERIHFRGMHYRKDIGQRGLTRWVLQR
jgi:phosphoribosylamine---glycine ligase